MSKRAAAITILDFIDAKIGELDKEIEFLFDELTSAEPITEDGASEVMQRANTARQEMDRLQIHMKVTSLATAGLFRDATKGV